MTFTVLGTDDEALRITVTDGLGYSISVVDNDSEFGTTVVDDAQNNLQIVTLATSSDYTDQDARASISAGGDLAYNNTTGVISYTEPTVVSTFTNDANYATETYVQTQVNDLIDGAPGALDTLNELAAALNDDADAYTTLNDLITANADNIALKFNTDDFNTTFDTRLATKDTDDVAEGDNLYYTSARANADFDTRLATKSTTNLSEGSNLYHTTDRVQAVIDTNSAGFITDYTVTQSDVTDHEAAIEITESQITDLQSYITDYTVTESDVTDHEAALEITESQITDLDKYTNADFDTRLATKSTSDVAEGTNLYYTDARANSAIDTRVTGSFIDALDTVSDGGTY